MQSEVPQPDGDPFVAARQPLIRPIRKRIGHLLREGEGFLLNDVLFNAEGARSRAATLLSLARHFPLKGESPSTILLRKIASGTAQDDSFISSKFKV